MSVKVGNVLTRRFYSHFRVAMLTVAMVAGAHSAAEAAISDPRIEAARQCTQHFARQERLHGMPTHVLAAISATESGRWNDTLGMVLPWPWTLNAEGQGFYFDTKEQAIRKVRALQRQGVKSIDVGCMQISLKHHPHAFASLEQAFDPKHNVGYAAKFLRGHYDEMKNWNRAIAAYHSKTPKFGNVYLARVEKSWNAITGKVRMAQASRPTVSASRNRSHYRVIRVGEQTGDSTRVSFGQSLDQAALDTSDMINEAPASVRGERRAFQLASLDPERGGAQRGMRLRAVDQLTTMRPRAVATGGGRLISVRDQDTSRSNPIVIRPTTSRSKIKASVREEESADVRQSAMVSGEQSLFVTQHNRAKQVTNRTASSKSSAEKPAANRGPKFVFVQ